MTTTKNKQSLLDILFKVSELKMSVDVAESRILKMNKNAIPLSKFKENPSKEFIVAIYAAFGFKFIAESPKGRLLFTDNEDINFQLWIPNEPSLENLLTPLYERTIEKGIRIGKDEIRRGFKELMELT